MTLIHKKTLKPRKRPVQARSSATVEAIYDAAIQVLLKVGVKNITTTRVAERAGVSVGTLYQYHSNIQSLMAAVLERHLDYVTQTLKVACEKTHNRSLDDMIKVMINTLIDSKMVRAEVSRALYAVNSDLNCAHIVRRASIQSMQVIQAMLETSTDYKISDVSTVAAIIVDTKTGPIKTLLEMGPTPKTVEDLKHHLILLYSGYLKQAAMPKRRKSK